MKTGLRILNLEDDEHDAALIVTMISTHWPDCDFVHVCTREEFVEALEEGGFDLILSDHTLPDFNGQQALELAREKAPDVPFLFVSGTIGEEAAIEALKSGATDYVLKHRLKRLIPAVDRALREVAERKERERAELAMSQSEYKYRELFESLNDAAFLADARTEKIIDTNRSAQVVLHCSRSEILGRKTTQFLSNNTGGESDHETCECKLLLPTGDMVPVSVHATRLNLYGRPLVLRLCHVLEGKKGNGQERGS